jgi:hypothetical protein
MRTQETFGLLQSAKEIRVAIDSDGDRVGGLLNEQHPLPVEEGEPAFDYRKHMQHLKHQLNLAADDVAASEDDLVAEQIRISRLQSDRDDLVTVNYDNLVAARQGLESLYKRGGFELAHVAGKTPEVPDQLVEQLGQTVKLFRQPAVEPRSLKVEGFSVDLGAVADGLETGAVELRGVLDGLEGARKTAEGLLVIKRKKIEVLRRTILWVGRTTEGLFHLAGEDDLADRIRTSTRRPLRPSEEPADEPPPQLPASETSTAS